MEIVKRTATSPRRQLYTIEPEEYVKKKLKGRLGIADTETDAFQEGRIVKPFTCGYGFPICKENEGFIGAGAYHDFWGDDCITQMFDHIAENYPDEKIVFFGHNWGNFDVYFTTHEFDAGHNPFIKNGRLSRVECRGNQFRDSYDLLPVSLDAAMSEKDGGKLVFNYAKMERVYDPSITYKKEEKYDMDNVVSEFLARDQCYQWLDLASVTFSPREAFKDQILYYQKRDIDTLGTLVVEWLDMFGDRMSMASVALPLLRSFHGFESVSESVDNELRPYYFGGRCQAFEMGVIRGHFKGYDINSSYPDVMRRIRHPVSDTPHYEKRISQRTHFARIRAFSNGALPVRKDDGGLDFPVGTRDFFACIHEIKAGLDTGTLKIHQVYESMYFTHETVFDDFIDYFYAKRLEAGANGDEVRKLFYKLVMNSSYGKFAQDPRKYERWLFDPDQIPMPMLCEECHELAVKKIKRKPDDPVCFRCEAKTHDAYGWYLHTETAGKLIYARPQPIRSGSSFFNVATAASITSAARASLLYGINQSVRPLYCDTDSLICEALHADLDNKRLGAWKHEFDCDEVDIGGKKLYACWDNSVLVKKASKGVRLTGEQIRKIAQGDTIEYANPVPKFSLFKTKGKNVVRVDELVSAEFVNRKISRTMGV